jgi:hypothetical protein
MLTWFHSKQNKHDNTNHRTTRMLFRIVQSILQTRMANGRLGTIPYRRDRTRLRDCLSEEWR